jgi:hypothetical protein
LEINRSQEPFDIAHLFPPAKTPVTKKEKRGPRTIEDELRGKESSRQILENYMERLAERKALLRQGSEGQAVTKAKSYMQETAEEYLKYIDWENDTFEEDMRLFWISASNYYKSHTHSHFVKILEWIRKKDSLNPKQVAKLFNK